MSKVTSKLQLTVPKAIADQYGIRPGDDLQWIPEGETIRVELARRIRRRQTVTLEERIEMFDRGSERLTKIHRELSKKAARSGARRQDRDWTREELYHRGFPR